MSTLSDLHLAHEGKTSDKWSSYLAAYDEVFRRYQLGAIDLLEIGIQNGGSLEVYAKYFQNARHIIGCDIEPLCANLKFDDMRISVVVGDANSNEAEQKIVQKIASFDVIVDDGSHHQNDIVRAFARYFPRLKSDGLYAIEDLHTSYWAEYGGGLFHQHSAIAFFKRLIDILNREHWMTSESASEFLQSHLDYFNIQLDEALISQIHSITFHNSICLIQKKAASLNVLGKRNVVGKESAVFSADSLRNAKSPSSDQSQNPSSSQSADPERILPQYAEQQKQIRILRSILDETRSQLTRSRAQSKSAENSIGNLHSALASTQEARRATESQLDWVLRSRSWRVTAPIRVAHRAIRGDWQAVRLGFLGFAMRNGRRHFHRLPESWRRVIKKRVLGTPSFSDRANGPLFKRGKSFSADFLDLKTCASAASVGSIAIHLHVFYPDLTEEMAGYIKKMPFAFDLFVSTCTDEGLKQCERAFANLRLCNNLTIEKVENRGRDIGPLFCTFGERLKNYDYIAHLHSKKSAFNAGATAGWRQYLFGGLLGNAEQIKKIFGAFASDRSIGIIYPQHFSNLPYWANTWLGTRELGRLLTGKLGTRFPIGYFDFPAGSMFWIRGRALAPLLDLEFKLNDFPIENGQTDGTLAHCIERLFVLAGEPLGYRAAIIPDTQNCSWSPWRLDQYLARQLDHVAITLSDPRRKLIAFDVFDTLLERPFLWPESTKKAVERRLPFEAAELFRRFRQQAEGQARRRTGKDVGIDAIYKEMASISGAAESVIDLVKNTELDIEKRSLTARAEGLALYKQAVSSDKPIVLISDMFLPKDLIELVLRENGVNSWKSFYLSNEIGLRKDQGSLYDKLLSDFGITAEGLIMIGDNERSDVQIPSDRGAGTIHLLRGPELARGLPRMGQLILDQEAKSDLDDEITLAACVNQGYLNTELVKRNLDCLVPVSPYNIGYCIAGPLVAAFVDWLDKKSKADGIEVLHFLAREGEILKAAFEIWTKGRIGVEIEYLEVSRRALSVPAISDFNDIMNIAKGNIFNRNNLAWFLRERFGLEPTVDQWKELETYTGFKADTPIEFFDEHISFLEPALRFFTNHILAQAGGERENALLFLKSRIEESKRSAVVDIGYSATIQGYLNELTKKPINGYYWMTTRRAETICNRYHVSAQGCFVSGAASNPPFLFLKAFELEKFLSSDNPQVLRYERGTTDSEIKVIFKALSESERATSAIRTDLQQGILDCVAKYKEVSSDLVYDFSPSRVQAVAIAEKFFFELSASEENFLRSFVLDDFYCGRGIVG